MLSFSSFAPVRGCPRTLQRALMLAIGLAVLCARAESPEAEIERAMQALVEETPAQAEISFKGFAEPDYVLDGAEVLLDGVQLKVPPIEELREPGKHRIVTQPVAAGVHRLMTRLRITHNPPKGLFKIPEGTAKLSAQA